MIFLIFSKPRRDFADLAAKTMDRNCYGFNAKILYPVSLVQRARTSAIFKTNMADSREMWMEEEYETNRRPYDDRGGFGRNEDEANGLADTRREQSHHSRSWRFNTLTDFLEYFDSAFFCVHICSVDVSVGLALLWAVDPPFIHFSDYLHNVNNSCATFTAICQGIGQLVKKSTRHM